jgi:hypothetical protein
VERLGTGHGVTPCKNIFGYRLGVSDLLPWPAATVMRATTSNQWLMH